MRIPGIDEFAVGELACPVLDEKIAIARGDVIRRPSSG